MSLHVIFVLHGETLWHAENRYAGSTDIALTERGHAQSRALADWAEQADLTAIFASPLTRSQETARESAVSTGLPVSVDERLRELDFGIAEGLTRGEMQLRFPDHLAAFKTDPVANHFPKGENPLAASDRCLEFLTDLEADHREGRVLVVGHSTAIRLALCRILGLPLRQYRRTFPFLANCALNELVLSDGVPSLADAEPPRDPRSTQVTTILAAGDHFVLNSLLIDRLRPAALGAAFRELTLPWPVEPFGEVAEVREASSTEDQLIEALSGVDICVTQMAPLTERILKASPDLRLFCVSRGGPVNANLEAATRHGVAVSFAPGRNATATAEQTVALMTAAVRRVPATHADLAAGTWRGDYYMFDKVGPELEGSTVGIVGYGAIGSRVARILHGFGAHVLVADHSTARSSRSTARRAGDCQDQPCRCSNRHTAAIDQST